MTDSPQHALDGTKADGAGNHGFLATLDALSPAQVTFEECRALCARVRATYEGLVAFVDPQRVRPVSGDVTGGLSGAAAHVAYYLGASRQRVRALA
ncbi:hypothetical protein [Deinococcus sp.]|uniref:hypothetical protein n=1 Tax=Deinococcus sp. TaxID=47478 RepID=UPI0025C54BF5|nr:hypothetical protein [Deinococcus sp.]